MQETLVWSLGQEDPLEKGKTTHSNILTWRVTHYSFHPTGNCCKVKVKVAQSCPTLCNPKAYTVRGILQARILDWVAFPFSRGSSWPRGWTQVSHIARRFFTNWAIREQLEIRENWDTGYFTGTHPNFQLLISCILSFPHESFIYTKNQKGADFLNMILLYPITLEQKV